MRLGLGLGLPYGARAAAFSPLSLGPVEFCLANVGIFQNSNGTGAVATDDPVGYLGDLTGGGNPPIQGTEAARPVKKASGGLHWLEFDGVNHFLVATGLVTAAPLVRVSAIRQITWTNADAIFSDVVNDRGYLFQDSVSPTLAIYNGASVASTTDAAVGADVVVVERHNGAASRIKIDNGSYATGDAGTATSNGLTVGARSNGSGPANFRLYGFVQFDYDVPDDGIAQLVTYFAALQGRVL